ncbi:MAG: 16S rRNA (guanine(527)-N(7))-methyltransferase RsmG [Victivallales bacterium]|nr:16S rRNA (guanine(527)-N(7))-methyltransferase RsmG [Victivallales bacterium]MCF7889387.1 16S rRNA (guanine(527)-N(7))-methyltransferase RsmG [Victivallales bacterium]
MNNYFTECGIQKQEQFTEIIKKFKDFLKAENCKYNLTRISGDKEFWNRHICDSISIAKYFPEIAQNNYTVLDIGCGAGFPSFVLAAAFSNLEVTAIDSVGKKVNFLKSAAASSKLDNLEVVHVRSKEYKTDNKFDIITARAVGDILKIFRESRKLLKENGHYILYKTPENIDEELEKLNRTTAKFNFKWETSKVFELPIGKEKRIFVVGRKAL